MLTNPSSLATSRASTSSLGAAARLKLLQQAQALVQNNVFEQKWVLQV